MNNYNCDNHTLLKLNVYCTNTMCRYPLAKTNVLRMKKINSRTYIKYAILKSLSYHKSLKQPEYILICIFLWFCTHTDKCAMLLFTAKLLKGSINLHKEITYNVIFNTSCTCFTKKYIWVSSSDNGPYAIHHL